VDEPLTTTSTAPATGSAGNGHAKLFVSYSRKDRSFVERLSEALKASGQDIWVDLQDIRASEDWPNAIHSAIEGADAFVFVVSPDSVDPTSVCVQEIDHAVAHNKRSFRSFAAPSIHVPFVSRNQSEGSTGFPFSTRTASKCRSKNSYWLSRPISSGLSSTRVSLSALSNGMLRSGMTAFYFRRTTLPQRSGGSPWGRRRSQSLLRCRPNTLSTVEPPLRSGNDLNLGRSQSARHPR
jgi:hypothetical protein